MIGIEMKNRILFGICGRKWQKNFNKNGIHSPYPVPYSELKWRLMSGVLDFHGLFGCYWVFCEVVLWWKSVGIILIFEKKNWFFFEFLKFFYFFLNFFWIFFLPFLKEKNGFPALNWWSSIPWIILRANRAVVLPKTGVVRPLRETAIAYWDGCSRSPALRRSLPTHRKIRILWTRPSRMIRTGPVIPIHLVRV